MSEHSRQCFPFGAIEVHAHRRESLTQFLQLACHRGSRQAGRTGRVDRLLERRGLEKGLDSDGGLPS